MSPERVLKKVDAVQNRTSLHDLENERSILVATSWIFLEAKRAGFSKTDFDKRKDGFSSHRKIPKSSGDIGFWRRQFRSQWGSKAESADQAKPSRREVVFRRCLGRSFIVTKTKTFSPALFCVVDSTKIFLNLAFPKGILVRPLAARLAQR